jgi:Winged helix domain, variant/ATPase family associated with various cellular activities (AAA)
MALPAVTASDPSILHLGGRLDIVEERVGRAVELRRAADPDPGDRFRGLYVSDAQADALLRDRTASGPLGAEPIAPEPVDQARLESLERAADAAEAGGADLRLRRLARTFDLAPLDVELLLVALAPEIDPRFERLYGYLNDDVSRRRPTVGLALALCGIGGASGPGRARLAASGPLVAGGLLEVEDHERPFLGRALRVPDRVVSHLLGDDDPDASLSPLLLPAIPAEPSMGADLARALEAGSRLVYLREAAGGDAGGIAVAAFRAMGAPDPVVLDLAALDAAIEPRPLLAVAIRESRLRGSGLVAGPVDGLAERVPDALRAVADASCPVVLHGTRSWDPTLSRRVALLLAAGAPTPEVRRRAWQALLPGPGEGGSDGTLDVPSYRLSVPQIARAAESARLQAVAAGRPIGRRDVGAGVRAQNAAGLERLARRVEPSAGWSDLVLPPPVAEQLRDLADRARHRELVLDGWGLGAGSSRGRGLTALFAGDSGTGKTLSAEVVAGELGLDLYVVDLATVVDKYIGETEKNLDRIFTQADGVNGLLLFDEAEALFGKRTEVRDSHDRYANVEVAYLLQRMERFDGTAILTTNLRSNLDEAFTRRLDVLVDFPMPDEADRRRLWELHLGGPVPRAADLDLGFMAGRFRLSGGNVRNIVLTAAHRAAAADRPVTMADLVRATDREYRKLGRLSTEAEFAPYFHLISSTQGGRDGTLRPAG